VKTYLILFTDGGRYFQAQAVFGPHATASLRAQVKRSLNTLHVSPLPASQQPAAKCRAGQWTSCPQAVWVYEVMNRAHVFPLGSKGTHALIGKALTGTRSFALWTTPRRPRLLNRCRNVAGVRVCRSGVGPGVAGAWALAAGCPGLLDLLKYRHKARPAGRQHAGADGEGIAEHPQGEAVTDDRRLGSSPSLCRRCPLECENCRWPTARRMRGADVPVDVTGRKGRASGQGLRQAHSRRPRAGCHPPRGLAA
jgi:hypothetical protein